MNELNLNSARAKKCRLSHKIGKGGQFLLTVTTIITAPVGIYCIVWGDLLRIGYVSLAVATMTLMILLWYKYGLQKVPVNYPAKQLDDIIEQNLLAAIKKPITPRSIWAAAQKQSEARFVCNHLLLEPKSFEELLSDRPEDMDVVWKQCLALLHQDRPAQIHAGIIITSILLTSPSATSFLTQYKLRKEDVIEVLGWIDRHLDYWSSPKPFFGGVGRDWATGFTPTLEHFSQNVSLGVQYSGGAAFYQMHDDLLDGIVSSLSRGNGVALVGDNGTGRSTLVNGLAQKLLEGKYPELQYYQIVSLNASLILSYSGTQLEGLILRLFGEASSAGNIILFLNDAELFFGSGLGAFDMSQVLLPVLKNHRVKIIASFTPTDWQQLQAHHSALASGFTSITINEPDERTTYRVVEDTAVLMEHHHSTLISYEAVREAYRLSGQFMQERAYPGKAISLLEQSMPYSQHGALTAESVQAAVEKTKGVKVTTAQANEADMLLNLENRIHQRMINQTRAVGVIASALRRGRAGVSNPKRPVGSFLFLGPTGVGKTELAKSLAAIYFGDEHNMIRLDMSEYQQPDDVKRLLATGGQNEQSLLLAIRKQPFSVVLLDEIEKAHPNILNLLLQMLDEGQLTDEQGKPASFRSSIIIATSNAGASDITAQVRAGGDLEAFERPLIDKLIASGQFRPELVNRFDEVVLFRPLNEEELTRVATLMLGDVNKTLYSQQITVQLTPEALKQIVSQGYDPEFGARPMRRIIQKTVENAIAVKILRGEAQPGSTVILDVKDLSNSANS